MSKICNYIKCLKEQANKALQEGEKEYYGQIIACLEAGKKKPCVDCGILLTESQQRVYAQIYPLCNVCYQTRRQLKNAQIIPLYSQMPKIWRDRQDMLDGDCNESH